MENNSQLRLSWVAIVFLTLTPVIAISTLVLHFYLDGFVWQQWALFLAFYLLTGLSITAGYHRMYSHKSYKANAVIRFLFLFFGAGAFQNSLLKWATDHRRHHKLVDGEDDPYTISRGFFFAHMGWMFYKEDPKYEGRYATDLQRDSLVMWQHKYYLPLAIFVAFVLPTLIGWGLGSALGGFAFAGIFRMVFAHHCTFFVNSLAHVWGKQTYTDKNSARDNFVVALFTYGEGYHNFHHRFEADYRNGLKWYHFDPTKWLIQFLNRLGWVSDLKRVPETEILKARLRMEEKKVRSKVRVEDSKYDEMIKALRERVEFTQLRIRELKDEYQLKKRELRDRNAESVRRLKTELAMAKMEFRIAYNQWKASTRILKRRHALA